MGGKGSPRGASDCRSLPYGEPKHVKSADCKEKSIEGIKSWIVLVAAKRAVVLDGVTDMVRRKGNVEDELEGVVDELFQVDKDKAKTLGALRRLVRRVANRDARRADLVGKQGALCNTLEEIKEEDIGAEMRNKIIMRDAAHEADFAEWWGCYIHHALDSDDGSDGSTIGATAPSGK